jgi:hypothetical protein
MSETDWAAWSREAVRQLIRKNERWPAEHGLPPSIRYSLHVDRAELTFPRAEDELVAHFSVVASASKAEGTVLWGWANEALAAPAQVGLEQVREFGNANGLSLLTEPFVHGGLPEGRELLAIASRIMDASGGFIESEGDLTLFLALRSFESRAKPAR